MSIFGARSTVSEVMSGKRELTKAHIRRLSDYFHVSPEILFLDPACMHNFHIRSAAEMHYNASIRCGDLRAPARRCFLRRVPPACLTVKEAGARHLRRGSRRIPPLAADDRWPRRDAGHGCQRRLRPEARLQAEAQLLRPGRRHRAARHSAAHSLRASRGRVRGADQRARAHVLRRRQHLHAGHVVARVEGELLQVHQRDAQRHGGFQPPRRAEVSRRAQWHQRRRRLRAGAGLRRDSADRRPFQRRQPARSSAAGRAARHRRTHARGRQAQGAPRSRRHVLHQSRWGERRARQRVGTGGRYCRSGEISGAVRARAQKPGRRLPSRRGGCEGHQADSARPHASTTMAITTSMSM